MNCPNCQNPTKEVKVPSVNTGLFVKVDQCPNCGGLWFDRYEMYQIPEEEAHQIDFLDEKNLQKPTPIKKDLFCPKDNLPLVRLVDANIPQDTFISRCRKCEGVWVNRGELIKYKHFVEAKQKDQTWEEREKEPVFPGPGISLAEQKVIAAIGGQLLPIPMGLVEQAVWDEPFVLSGAGVELLKGLSQKEKMTVYRQLAQEHEQNIESEKRFINATINILNTILRLLVRL